MSNLLRLYPEKFFEPQSSVAPPFPGRDSPAAALSCKTADFRAVGIVEEDVTELLCIMRRIIRSLLALIPKSRQVAKMLACSLNEDCS